MLHDRSTDYYISLSLSWISIKLDIFFSETFSGQLNARIYQRKRSLIFVKQNILVFMLMLSLTCSVYVMWKTMISCSICKQFINIANFSMLFQYISISLKHPYNYFNDRYIFLLWYQLSTTVHVFFVASIDWKP